MIEKGCYALPMHQHHHCFTRCFNYLKLQLSRCPVEFLWTNALGEINNTIIINHQRLNTIMTTLRCTVDALQSSCQR